MEFNKGVLIATFEPPTLTDSCANINCEDNNPCTTNSCTNGACSYAIVPNGLACGSNKQCINGSCQEQAILDGISSTPIPGPAGESFNGFLLVGIGLLIIVAVTTLLKWRKVKD
jgi:hypothetical protein